MVRSILRSIALSSVSRTDGHLTSENGRRGMPTEQVVLITGASAGIGHCAASRL
jgi:hypothetical protein